MFSTVRPSLQKQSKNRMVRNTSEPTQPGHGAVLRPVVWEGTHVRVTTPGNRTQNRELKSHRHTAMSTFNALGEALGGSNVPRIHGA